MCYDQSCCVVSHESGLTEIASTEKIAQEKFFFQGGREKIGFFREIKMVYGSIARPERSKLGS